MQPKINNRTVSIELVGEFTAEDLDEIIADIAMTRAQLQPPVPLTPPPIELEKDLPEQLNPKVKLVTRADGSIRVYLRNEGYGWLAFTIPAVHRETLASFLSNQLGHTHTFQ